MSLPSITSRNRVRSPRNQLRTSEREWVQRRNRSNTAQPPPSRSQRISEAAWRLHDGMPLVWALLFAAVLIVSSAVSLALLAMAFGWQP